MSRSPCTQTRLAVKTFDPTFICAPKQDHAAIEVTTAPGIRPDGHLDSLRLSSSQRHTVIFRAKVLVARHPDLTRQPVRRLDHAVTRQDRLDWSRAVTPWLKPARSAAYQVGSLRIPVDPVHRVRKDGAHQLTRIAIVAVLSITMSVLVGCGGSRGTDAVAYVKDRLGACLTDAGHDPDTFAWTNLGRRVDGNGEAAYGVRLEAKDDSAPVMTVNLTLRNPNDAISWATTPAPAWRALLQPCMGVPAN